MSRPRGKPFEVGNKMGRGRPKGSRNKRSKEVRKMLDNYAIPVMSKCIGKALEGDIRALTMCMERIAPVERESGNKIKLPKLPEVLELSDIERSEAAVLNEIASGAISPSDGQKLYAILHAKRTIIENQDMQSRLSALEKLVSERER